jgi:DnaJ-class molecular chaperone
MTRKDQKNKCDICGGTGQVSYFKGVSRFLLSTSECEECAGTGFQLDSAPGKAINDTAEKRGKKGTGKTEK